MFDKLARLFGPALDPQHNDLERKPLFSVVRRGVGGAEKAAQENKVAAAVPAWVFAGDYLSPVVVGDVTDCMFGAEAIAHSTSLPLPKEKLD